MEHGQCKAERKLGNQGPPANTLDEHMHRKSDQRKASCQWHWQSDDSSSTASAIPVTLQEPAERKQIKESRDQLKERGEGPGPATSKFLVGSQAAKSVT